MQFDERDLRTHAKIIESKINRSVQACDDFYEFACGNYHPEIPKDATGITEFQIVDDTIEKQLHEVFKSPQVENDSNLIRNVKRLYSSCMDTGDK